jgi:hypothetical protein
VPLQKIYRSLRSVLLIFLVVCVLLVYVFTLCVPCCDFRIQTMFGSSLPPVVCKRAHVLLCYLCLLADSGVQRRLRLIFFPLAFSLFCVICTESERYLLTSYFRFRNRYFRIFSVIGSCIFTPNRRYLLLSVDTGSSVCVFI